MTSSGASRIDGTSAAGTVAVDGGTLVLGAANRLTAAPAVTIAGNAAMQLLGAQTFGQLIGAGGIDLGTFTLTTGSGGDSSYGGVMSGTGGIDKQGTSTFTLAGSNTYGGTTRVSAGTLALAAADTLADGSGVDCRQRRHAAPERQTTPSPASRWPAPLAAAAR